MEKIWKTKELIEPAQDLTEAAGSKLLAQLLVQRGIDSVKKIHDFLNPAQMKITSPFVFTDMQKAVDRIFDAVDKQEKIIIYGDFDADGVTSTSLLYKTLCHLNANVEFYIPNRENENHGLNSKALVKLIAKHKAKLIITVDCGVSDIEQVNFARGFKVDVIITDHHEAPEVLPEAFAIINPKAFNSLKKDLTVEEIEALNQLAGVGVAFKLACALLEKKEDYDFANELLPLVAVGTIADVVPLLYENRSFVEAGLKLIEQGKHYIHTDSAHSKQNRSVFYIVRESCGQCIRTCQLHDLLLQQVQVPRQIKTGHKQRNSGCSIYRILCCRRENAPACDTDY